MIDDCSYLQIILLFLMNAYRHHPFFMFRRCFHSSSLSLRSSNFNFLSIMMRRKPQGGCEAFVREPHAAQEAYHRVQRMTREGRVRELERRSQHYVKPKHRRQQRVERLLRGLIKDEFQEKLGMAMELMKANEKTAR